MAWQEVGGGVYVKWAKEGMVVEGIWQGLAKGVKPGRDGNATFYGTVDGEDGRLRFSATIVLQDRLSSVPVGRRIRITYTGIDAKTNAKLFKVEQEAS